MKLECEKYIPIVQSTVFKGATLADTPTTISLYRALVRSEEHIIRRYCTQKPHLIDIPGPKGTTPLFVATSRGDKSTVNILLSAGANVDYGMPVCKRTPLHIAMFMGYHEIAKILILKRADISLCDSIGLTFAHYAVDGSYLPAIKFCIDNGADTEARDANGWTLLLRAVAMQCGVAIVKYLLERDCNLFAKDSNKLSCFDHARLSQQNDVFELLEKVLKKKQKIMDATPKIEMVDFDAKAVNDKIGETAKRSELIIDLVDGV